MSIPHILRFGILFSLAFKKCIYGSRLVFVNVHVCLLELLMAISELSAVQLDKRLMDVYVYLL